MKQKKIRLGIVEDSNAFCDALQLFFTMSDEVEVVFSTDKIDSLPEQCKKYTPDVLLMDISLGRSSGLDGLKNVKKAFPAVKVLMCTVFSDDVNLFDAISYGADGYLLKSTPVHEIEAAVIEAFKGGSPITPLVASRVLQVFRQSNLSQRPYENLTLRENDILQALVKGFSYKQVAAELNISLGTVRTHIENVYAKLGVNSKAEAVAKYLKSSK